MFWRDAEASGRIVANENYTFSMESTKQEAQSLRIKIQIEISFGYLRLAAVCTKIARTSAKVRKTKLLPLFLLRAQKRISEQVLN